MKPEYEAHDLPVAADATPDIAEHAPDIPERSTAGLFYAACSDDYADEFCGCPICQARTPVGDGEPHPASANAPAPPIGTASP